MFDAGLVSISFRQLSPEALAVLCRKNQIHWIEWGSDVHAPYNDPQRLSEICKLQTEYDLRCSSYGTYFKLGEHDTAELSGYIRAAKTLGTNILRLWCGSRNFEEMTTAEREHIISECRKAAAIAEREHVILCMECHNRTFTNCMEGAVLLMESVNSPAFQMYWQPNQFRTQEENLAYARRIAKYTRIIHVFNWAGSNRYPLDGAADLWLRYLSCFDGTQKLLLEFMPDDRPESLSTEANTLNAICEKRRKPNESDLPM